MTYKFRLLNSTDFQNNDFHHPNQEFLYFTAVSKIKIEPKLIISSGKKNR